MSFENQINDWIELDNQLKLYNEKIKMIRDKKNIITQNILNYVDANQLTEKSVKIPDGSLKFVNLNTTQAITFKYLETCLSEIIKNDNQVKKILDYIKQRRVVKQQMEIKRFYLN
jgi:hypothetical protein